MSLEENVLGRIETLKPNLVRLTQKLIREKSVNPPGNEVGVARVLETELSKIGMKVALHHSGPNRVNVEAVLLGFRRHPRFLFNGHTDVVPEGDVSKWTVDPFGGVVKGDLLYGRGSSDMKGALASIATALRGITEAGVKLNGDVIFHAVADEEVGAVYGTKYMIAKGLARADMGIVAESSVFGGKIAIRQAARGNCWIRVKTFGKAAHASDPTHGVNAILKMSTLLLALSRLKLQAKPHKILPPPTISAGTVIKGGTKTNIIPEYCEAELDVRILPGMSKEQVVRKVTQTIDLMNKRDPQFSAKAEVFSYAPAVEIPETSPVVLAASKATEKVAGYRPKLRAGHGTNDSVYLVRDCGIPVIPGFGPGNDLSNAHGTDENVNITDLVKFAKIYALTTMYSLGFEAEP
jgi:succinyl-diaminopimelate desuccinylase